MTRRRLALNPLLPRPKGGKDAEGMKKQIPSNNATEQYLTQGLNEREDTETGENRPAPRRPHAFEES